MKKINDPGSRHANLNFTAPAASTPTTRNEEATRDRPVDIGSARVAPARSIDLHINELVLHGFSPADRRPIADAIERELSALLEHDGLRIDKSYELEFLNGGTFRTGQGDQQDSAGTNVARAIYGGLRR